MKISYFIAKRYLISQSSNNAINIIAYLSMFGVVVASMALFVVLSGFSGLKEFSKGFYLSSDPDIKITATKGKTFFVTDSTLKILKNEKDIAAWSQILEERAFFKYQEKEQIAYIYGVDANFTNVIRMDTTLIGGDWLMPENPYGIVVGNSISNKLSLGIDYQNPVSIYVPKPGNTYDLTNPSNMVNSVNAVNIGVFGILEEIDNKYVFAHLPIAQELLQYQLNQVSGIVIKLNPNTVAGVFAKSLQKKLGNNFKVQTREQLNAVFYKMLNTENLVLYFIFTLVLIIALFNIIGSIIMMILDKKNNLKTLNSLGMILPELRKIFELQGFMLSFVGMILGLILGITLVIIQKKYGLLMINAYLPYPVKLTFENFFIVILTMTFLSYIASKLAASRISSRIFE